ncbi:MAG: MmgE/PrpD family protein [Desulfurococcales archaeon]|nr:MmgE/PrpD family protein [Desulfurococcales archaeon]
MITPREKRWRRRKALADTLAVAAAAPRLNPQAARLALSIAGQRGAVPILGLAEAAPPLEAALANAILAHSIEYDDWLPPAYVHAGSIVVPLTLSLAFEKPLSEALRLIVAGYEAAYQAGALLGRGHYERWHSTATAGAAAAAAVTALSSPGNGDPAALSSALCLALNYAGGFWSALRTEPFYKPLSPANAVATGYLAAKAALERPSNCSDALREVVHLLVSESPAPSRGGEPGILFNEYKFYPTCRHTHSAIEAAERLSGRVPTPDIVSSVEVRVFGEAARVAGLGWPRSLEEARFSLRFLVAVALARGTPSFESLREAIGDPRVRALFEKTRVAEDPEFTRQYPERQPAFIRIRLESGDVLEQYIPAPKGSRMRRPSLEDILGKASRLAQLAGGHVYAIANRVGDAPLHSTIKDLIEETNCEGGKGGT